MNNLYETLGVAENASYPEIKAAYRHLAKQYHPDKIQNPSESDQNKFAEITEAYAVLSNLKRRQDYDRSQQAAPPSVSWHSRPHYSGYPYFQWDVFTPAMHTFFMGQKPRQDRQTAVLSILLNGKVIAIALLGALFFFKFFSAMNGTVLDKQTEKGLFQNISNIVTYKTAKEKEKKKRMRKELFDMLSKDDVVEKKIFSFTYRVNGKEIETVTLPRFLLQAILIYGALSLGLIFLEYGRK